MRAPAALVALLLLAGLVALVLGSDDLARWLTPFLDDSGQALRDGVRVAVQIAVLGGYLFAAWTLFVALTLLVGEPFHARIHAQTELMLGGYRAVPAVGLVASARDGLRLLRRSVLLAVCVFVIGAVPLVGTVVAAALATSVGAWLLADELLARPLEARGMDAAARARVLKGSRRAVLGFGLAAMGCFLVPFGAVVVMPSAVVGATLLARQLLGEPASLPDPGAEN